MLLDSVIAEADEAGADDVAAHVWTGNTASQTLFARSGFEPDFKLMNLQLDKLREEDTADGS